MLPGMELMSCPELAVPREVMHHVVRVESSYNPYAIGVVGGRLVRQPRNLPEAVSTARMLEERGYNFSLGLAQVNRYNLAKYGLESYEKAFQPCANLVAGSQILRECYGRSGGDWGKSFSCYYSGDFRTGFRHGYVQKVYASMRRGGGNQPLVVGMAPLQVVDRVSRRVSSSSRGAAKASAWGSIPSGSMAGSLAERRGSRMIGHPEVMGVAGEGSIAEKQSTASSAPGYVIQPSHTEQPTPAASFAEGTYAPTSVPHAPPSVSAAPAPVRIVASGSQESSPAQIPTPMVDNAFVF